MQSLTLALDLKTYLIGGLSCIYSKAKNPKDFKNVNSNIVTCHLLTLNHDLSVIDISDPAVSKYPISITL